jgi:hypothetical protein
MADTVVPRFAANNGSWLHRWEHDLGQQSVINASINFYLQPKEFDSICSEMGKDLTLACHSTRGMTDRDIWRDPLRPGPGVWYLWPPRGAVLLRCLLYGLHLPTTPDWDGPVRPIHSDGMVGFRRKGCLHHNNTGTIQNPSGR